MKPATPAALLQAKRPCSLHRKTSEEWVVVRKWRTASTDPALLPSPLLRVEHSVVCSVLFWLRHSPCRRSCHRQQQRALAFRSQRQVEAELDDMRSCMDGQPLWPRKRREPQPIGMELLNTRDSTGGTHATCQARGPRKGERCKPLRCVSF